MTIDPALLAMFPQAAKAQPAISVLLVAAPPNMPPRVQGEVINVDRSGQIIIATEEGQVIIQTDAKLSVGQKIELRLPPQTPGSPPIATVIPLPATPVRNEEVAGARPLPPPVMLEIAQEQTRLAAGLPPQVAPSAAGYTPPSAVPPAQTLFQLIGLDLPATVFDKIAAQTAQADKPVLPFGSAPLAAPSALPTSMTLERVHIVFIGGLDQASAALKQVVANPALLSSAAGATPGVNSSIPLMQPMLAQLVGLTPQKLPIFQTMPMDLPALPGTFAPPDSPRAIHTGSQIVLHSPILMTMQEERQTGPVAALLVTLPAKALSPEALFALETLPTAAPLFTQLLRDPASLFPAAMAAQMAALVPRPGSPRFAMNMAFALLGLSSGDPSQFFGKALLEALKPEQRAQLQKELQMLPTLGRDAPQAGELRMQIPVEMAGQLALWQLTVRHHENDPQSGGGPADRETPTRFILDLYMTQLGPLQMDGLAFSKSRRLDLILRTQEALMPEDRDMLRRESVSIFEKARLAGSIEFQLLQAS